MEGNIVIILGIVLLLFGWILAAKLLVILGIIALIVGLVLVVAGSSGHSVRGRRHWW